MKYLLFKINFQLIDYELLFIIMLFKQTKNLIPLQFNNTVTDENMQICALVTSPSLIYDAK